MYLCKRDSTLGYVSMQFWDFPNNSLFNKVQNFTFFGNLWRNLHADFFTVNIKFSFTFGEWNVYLNHSHKKRKDSLETRAEPAVFSL